MAQGATFAAVGIGEELSQQPTSIQEDSHGVVHARTHMGNNDGMRG